jgi:hypothetical protein
MIDIQKKPLELVGTAGSLAILPDDDITPKLAMIFEGECDGLGPATAAAKFGYTRQRYYQLLHQFQTQGARGLQNQRTGPKTNYRRTDEVVRQVIRHQFLDRQASPEVIA